MKHERVIAEAKKLLEEEGYTIVNGTQDDLNIILIGGGTYSSHFHHVRERIAERQLLGKAFELVIIDDLKAYMPEIPPPKNKPWYQRFDKHVGKHRK